MATSVQRHTNTNAPPPASKPEGGSQQLTIKQQLMSPAMQAQIGAALPKHITAERMCRVAMTAITKSPKLAQCTQASFFTALLNLSQWGLEPDGRRAHLIPFENKRANTVECQLIIDYKGYAELIYRSGLVSYLHADVVREGDLFAYDKGELRQHVPWFLRKDANKPKEAGKIYAVYAMARMKDGSEKADVLSVDEVYAIRDGSQGWFAFQKGWAKQSPWDPNKPVSEQEMMKKTAFRRLSKWLPLSAEVRDAMDSDDDDAIDVVAAPSSSQHAEQAAAGGGSLLENLTKELEESEGAGGDTIDVDAAPTNPPDAADEGDYDGPGPDESEAPPSSVRKQADLLGGDPEPLSAAEQAKITRRKQSWMNSIAGCATADACDVLMDELNTSDELDVVKEEVSGYIARRKNELAKPKGRAK